MTHDKITEVCNSLDEFLREKNKRYGDSALSPVRVFSGQSTLEALLVRMDDKLSRIKNSDNLRKNDIVDLIGYLVLVCVERGWTDFSEFID